MLGKKENSICGFCMYVYANFNGYTKCLLYNKNGNK